MNSDAPRNKSNKRHGIASAVRKRRWDVTHKDIYLVKKMSEGSLSW
jgi:hypothetical protein